MKKFVIFAAVMGFAPALQADSITGAYEKYLAASPDLKSQSYVVQAAAQDVVTQKRGYYPTVGFEAMQLHVGQDIDQKGPGVFQNGRANYSNTRAKIELDMPIIDFTLKPKVEEARAFERYQEGVLKGRESLLTQRFVTSFLQAVRVAHLEESVDRVIARTQKEQEVVAQRFKEKMATVEDIENIKMALIGMQHEKRILSEQRLQYFSQIGIDPKSKVSFALANSSKLDLPRPVGSMELRSPHTVMLQAEIDALKSKGEAVSGEDKPRLSLYGLMQHDDAGGSQFGPERRLNGYEAGLLLKWNWFDGGVNRSEVKRLDLMKKAKEAELEAILSQTNQESAFQEDGLTLAKYNLQSLDQLVEHQQSILKANESSYSEGGDITYIQMMNSFLVYEAQVRQQVHGKFDYLQKQAELYAGHTGWSSNLIKDLDRLFVKK